MAIRRKHYNYTSLGTVAATLSIAGVIFKMCRKISKKIDLEKTKTELKNDLDNTKKELGKEINQVRDGIKDDYNKLAMKDDIKKLVDELKPPPN